MPRIFADLHHEDLFYSLQLLFEKRLGWPVYRPLGLEWHTEGFWAVFNHPDTAKQYLEPGWIPAPNASGMRYPINATCTLEGDGTYLINNPAKDTNQRAITLEAFKNLQFDIIISSIPQHIPLFDRLIMLYQPQAKHVFQVGNAWGCVRGVQNIMASTKPFLVTKGINACFYHQEFDRDIFKYEAPGPESYTDKKINSYIHWMKGPEIIETYKSFLPEYKFTRYGAGMDADLCKTADVAAAIRSSMFSWHYKPEGDGYGYSCHQSYAVGRPQIVHKGFYAGKLAEDLMIDGQTCIDFSNKTAQDAARLIREHSQPDKHLKMCEAARDRFNKVVNFDWEFQYILKPFIDRVLNS